MVEGTGLENRRASNSTEGSNPSLSARKMTPTLEVGFNFLAESVELNPDIRGNNGITQQLVERRSLPSHQLNLWLHKLPFYSAYGTL